MAPAHDIVSGDAPSRRVSKVVLFSSHLLCPQHFLTLPTKHRRKPNSETAPLRHAVKNAWVSRQLRAVSVK
jgi:hypothetical protein